MLNEKTEIMARFCLDIRGRDIPYFNTKSLTWTDGVVIEFRVSFAEANDQYKFRLMDRLHAGELWKAATNRRFTDVEFVVAGQSFPAHQFIVAARSRYLAK